MTRAGERGQVLPFAAVALLAMVLIAVAVARVGGVIAARMRTQTAVDATALSAATAYSRALNVAAVSNEMLITAALADLGLKVFGSSAVKLAAKPLKVAGLVMPASFTEMVESFQDVWAGIGSPGAFAVPGAGALMMQGVAGACAAANGLEALVFWNDREDPGGLVPDLNLRRATLADMAWLLGGDGTGTEGEAGRVRMKYEGKERKETYSYRDGKTGRRVQVPADKVERIAFRNKAGKVQTAARIKERGGKFLKVGKGTEKVLKFFDVPFPLVDRAPKHRVLVAARSRAPLPRLYAGWGGVSVGAAARAEAGGGAVFDAAFGDPNFEPRLVRVSEPGGAGSLAVMLLSDPLQWDSWAANAAGGAAWNWASNRIAEACRRPQGRNI